MLAPFALLLAKPARSIRAEDPKLSLCLVSLVLEGRVSLFSSLGSPAEHFSNPLLFRGKNRYRTMRSRIHVAFVLRLLKLTASLSRDQSYPNARTSQEPFRKRPRLQT